MKVGDMKASARTPRVAQLPRKAQTMTWLTLGSDHSRAPHIWKRVGGICWRLFATFIALRKRKAASATLSRLSDRELSDIGLHRGQIGAAMEDMAQYRASKQISNV